MNWDLAVVKDLTVHCEMRDRHLHYLTDEIDKDKIYVDY